MKKTLLTTLAVVGLAAVVQATPVSFDFQSNGINTDLGNSSTFTVSGVSITAYSDTFLTSGSSHLFSKNQGSGGEIGLGLTSDTSLQNEITIGHFIQLGLPTSPVSTLNLTFLSSIQRGETAFIYYSTTLGSLGSKIATLTADGSYDVSAYATGYIGITAGSGNVLLESISVDAKLPDGGSTMLLMGSALTVAGLIRRKLVA